MPISSEEWRANYFESAEAPLAADSADADRDGLLNWQEYLAGTDPTREDSKLVFLPVEPAVGSGPKQVVLRWQTVPGKVYEVLQSSSPEGPTWILRDSFQGDGNEAEFVETETGGVAAFYRLRVQ
jgi:hypothetical protein